MYYLSLVYFVNQPLHVSGIFVAQSIPTRPTDSQLKSTTRTNFLYIYIKPPDDGQQICPKHVEVVIF